MFHHDDDYVFHVDDYVFHVDDHGEKFGSLRIVTIRMRHHSTLKRFGWPAGLLTFAEPHSLTMH